MMCRLCEIYEKRKLHTRIYGENDNCIVVGAFNSDGSKSPRLMSVLKKHTENPTQTEIDAVMNTLIIEADNVKKQIGLSYEIEPYHSTIGHFHLHASF